MSEERRKRQEQRFAEENPKPIITGKLLVIVLLVLIVAGAFYAINRNRRASYDSFAKCMATKSVKMYGLYWCTHCEEQKEMFGSSFQYIPYIECGVKGVRSETPECLQAGIKNFPTWQFSDGSRSEGTKTMQYLSEKTGCSLP
jgi:hypothetical protein